MSVPEKDEEILEEEPLEEEAEPVEGEEPEQPVEGAEPEEEFEEITVEEYAKRLREENEAALKAEKEAIATKNADLDKRIKELEEDKRKSDEVFHKRMQQVAGEAEEAGVGGRFKALKEGEREIKKTPEGQARSFQWKNYYDPDRPPQGWRKEQAIAENLRLNTDENARLLQQERIIDAALEPFKPLLEARQAQEAEFKGTEVAGGVTAQIAAELGFPPEMDFNAVAEKDPRIPAALFRAQREGLIRKAGSGEIDPATLGAILRGYIYSPQPSTNGNGSGKVVQFAALPDSVKSAKIRVPKKPPNTVGSKGGTGAPEPVTRDAADLVARGYR